MNFVYIQCAGGVGAQVLSSLVIEYFNKSKIFKDGRYFGSSGAQSIPDGISFFEKKIDDQFLKFRWYEKNRYICWAVRRIMYLLSLLSNRVVYIDDFNYLKLIYASKLETSYLCGQLNECLIASKQTGPSNHLMVAHIRRGDYLKAGLPTLSLEYLYESLEAENYSSNKLTIVTDSSDLVSFELDRLNRSCDIISGEALKDLGIMTLSKIFIASDSQFSLVAILLSKSMETVLVPQRWHVLGISELLAKRPSIKKVVMI